MISLLLIYIQTICFSHIIHVFFLVKKKFCFFYATLITHPFPSLTFNIFI